MQDYEMNGKLPATQMTKREEFASRMMAGLLANQYNVPLDKEDFDNLAAMARMSADSLLEVLGD